MSKTEELKQRVRQLETENRKLMANHGQIVSDCNRRVEMHLKEIRLLKEENKKLKSDMKDMQELCCFLDDQRQKTRRLSREWQKFGRYTSTVMKQEVTAYQEKLKDLEQRQNEVVSQNAELKGLCLYLDEQREQLQKMIEKCNQRSDEGEGSEGSGRSSDSEMHKPECEQKAKDDRQKPILVCSADKENALRQITAQENAQQGPLVEKRATDQFAEKASKTDGFSSDQLLSYIQSIENRVGYLEKSNQEVISWRSDSNLTSEQEEVPIQQEYQKIVPASAEECRFQIAVANKNDLVDSQTSTGTASSGTTYASTTSDDSAVTAVYVVGQDSSAEDSSNCSDQQLQDLRSATLTPIDEETLDDQDDDTLQTSVHFSPQDTSHHHIPDLNYMQPAFRRFSISEPADIFPFDSSASNPNGVKPKLNLSRSHSLNLHEPIEIDPPPKKSGTSANGSFYSCRQQSNNSLVEAVKVLRVQEMVQRQCKNTTMTSTETEFVQQMCQIAWDTLDRQSAKHHESQKHETEEDQKLKMSTV